jgi:PAS domain S-box-containing protein
MAVNDDEKAQLRSVALQNARTVLAERRRAQDALRKQSEWLRVTLASIGDGVISTDAESRVTFMNAVAATLTGWTPSDAEGQPLSTVFNIVNETTRKTVENPTLRALKEGTIVGLANHTILIARNGREWPIDDSAAPIRDEAGTIFGAVLVFREIAERKRDEAIQAEQHRLISLRADVSSALASAHAVPDVLQECCEALVQNLNVAFARIWTLGPAGDVLELRASAGLYRHLNGQHSRVPVGQFKIGRIASNQQAHLTNEVLNDPNVSDREWAAREGMVAFAGYPLVLEDRVVGVIAMFARSTLSDNILAELAPLANGIAQYLERKQVEEQLRASESRATNIVQSIADGLMTMDSDWRISYLNRRAEEILAPLQKTNSGVFGKVFWDEFPHMLGTVFESSFRHAMSEQSKVTFDAWYSPLECWFDVRAYPGRSGLSVYFLDVTDRKRAEARITEHDRRFRMLVEQVKDYAIFTAGTDGRATSWNEGVKRVLGFDEAEFIGQDIIEAIFNPEDVLNGVAQKELNEAATNGSASDDRWMKKKDGTPFYALGVTTGLCDENGKLLGFMKVMRDQTDRKKMEDELRRIAADLSEADHRKNEFLAILAHELRNPLAPISNALQIVQRSAGDAEAIRQASEMMDRHIRHMVRLVDDLLDVSRISRGKIGLRHERVELAQIINQAIETTRSAIDSARHQLTVDLPPHPVYLDGDAVRLAQVFSNLLNNSCKYSEPDGQIQVIAILEGNEVVVSVDDTGVGIPSDMLPRIFEMFTQVDRSLERSQGGLGIGLSLVRSLVTLHDGSVTAHSAGPGRGSQFVVRLPALVEKPKPMLATAAIETPRTTARRILVVDDNRDSAISLAMLLKMMGHQTQTVYDGLAAVTASLTFLPEVILLDIGLPKLNGYDAARQIRLQPGGDKIVLVALTGWGQDEDRQKSKDAGFDHHMVKPVDHAALTRFLAGMTTVQP